MCFQATTGISGMVGSLGTLTAGSGGTPGTYANVPLTVTAGGGSGSNATANIIVGSGGGVTSVTILNPGTQYVVNNTLSALSANIGGVTGFSVPVASISINSSLAGGAVGMFIPGTMTTKQTWMNATETILNTNPVQLDLNGCALMYGVGTYRQILYDSLGNTVWDQPTTVISQNPVYAGLAGGTANAITVTDQAFAGTDGQAVTFLASNTNTGATTINPSGYGAISVVKNTSTGPAALSGNEIIGGTPGNLYTVTYSATYNEFFLPDPNTAGSSGTYVPSGAVMAFALSSCPTGFVNANGSGSTINMVGTVARGYDPTNVHDPNGSSQSIGSFEQAMMGTHFMLDPGAQPYVVFTGSGGSFGTNTGTNLGESTTTGGVTNLPSVVTSGNDERGASTIVLYCQKT